MACSTGCRRGGPARSASRPSPACRCAGTAAGGSTRCRDAAGCRGPGRPRRPAAGDAASSFMSSTSKLLTPQWRICPPRLSSSNAQTVSSSGTCRASATGTCRAGRCPGGAGSRRRPRASRRRSRGGHHLADQEHLVAAAGDRPPTSCSAGAAAVELGGVDQRHPEVEAGAQRVEFDLRRMAALGQMPGARGRGPGSSRRTEARRRAWWRRTCPCRVGRQSGSTASSCSGSMSPRSPSWRR